jgi:hypothetical protein
VDRNGAIAIAGGSVTTLDLTSGAGITDSGTITVTNGLSATGDANGAAITLDDIDVTGGTVALSTTNSDATIDNDSAIDFAASGVGANLSATTAAGDITQAGAVTATGTATFTSAGDITLTNGGNSFGDLTVTGGVVQITEADAITDGGAWNTTGATTLNAGVNNITLDEAGSTTGALTLNGAAVTVDRNGAIAIAGGSVTTLDLTSGAGITDSGTITVTNGLSATGDANGAAITLDDIDVTGGTVALSTTDSNATIDNDSAIDFGTSNVGANLTATAGGQISQTGGALTVSGTAGLTVADGADVLLHTAANDIAGGPSFATSGVGTIGNLRYRNTNAGATLPAVGNVTTDVEIIFNNAAVDLPAMTIGGDLDVTAGGNITDSGDVSVTGAGIFDAGANDITLGDGTIATFGDLTVTGGVVQITEANAITDGGAWNTTGATTLNAGVNNITLDEAGSTTGALTLNGAAVTVDRNGAIAIAGGSVTTLDLTSGAGITDSGTITVTNGLSATGDANGAAITLDDIDVTGGTVALSTTNSDATIDNDSAIDFAASGVGANLSATTAAGDITQAGAVTATGTATFTSAGDITLTNGGNSFGDLTVTGGVVQITEADAITDGGAWNTTGATTLNAGVNNITLDEAGSTTGALTLNGAAVTVDRNGAIAIAGGSVTTLDLTSGAGITDSGTITVTNGLSATGDANGAAITLDDIDVTGGTVALSTTDSNATIDNDSAIDFGTSNVGANLTATAGGQISQTGGALTVSGTAGLTVADGADVLLHTAANDIAGGPSFATSGVGTIGNLRYRNTNAGATLPAVGNVTTDVEIIFNNAAVDLPAMTIGGDLDVTAGGNITDSGDVSVTGAGIFDAGANDITLGDGTQADFADLDLTGAAVTVAENSATTLARVNADSLMLISGGDITGTGTIITETTASFNTNGAITLDIATNDFDNDDTGDAVTFTNATIVQITDTAALTLGESDATGAVTITTGSGLTVGGAIAANGGFTHTAAQTNLGAGITTTAGAGNIDLAAVQLDANVTLDTNTGGANVTITGTVNAATDNAETLTVDAGAGNVDFQSAIGNLAAGTPGALTVSASEARFQGNVTTNGAQTITATTTRTDGTHTVEAAASGITIIGDLALDAATTLSATSGVGNVQITGNIDGDALQVGGTGTYGLTLSAGTGTVILGGQIGTDTTLANLTTRSDDISLGGNVSVPGTINLYATTAATPMNLGFVGGNWELDDTEIGYLQAGTTALNIGENGTQSGAITFDTVDLSALDNATTITTATSSSVGFATGTAIRTGGASIGFTNVPTVNLPVGTVTIDTGVGDPATAGSVAFSTAAPLRDLADAGGGASESSISIDTSTTGATAGDVDLGNVGTVGDPIVTLTVTAGGGTTDGTVTFHGDAYAATIDIPSGGELLLSGTYNTGNNPWAITVPARQTAHVVIITGTATLDFQDTLDGDGNNLTLQGDEIDFTGGANTVSAIGTLVMRPSNVSVTVDVGSGGGTGSGTLVLDATDLAALNTDIADGVGEAIRIGWDAADAPAGADGTAAITVGGATFQSPTQFVAEGAGGSVVFTGAFNGNDDATLDVDAAAITLGDGGGDSITTTGNTVRFGGPVTLEDNFTVSTGGGFAGNIDFDDTATIDDGTGGPWNLTLTAGTGDVTFGDALGAGVGQIGGTQPIADLQVNGTGVTFFSNTAAVAASSVDINAAGTAQINGSITTTGAVTIDSNGGTTLTDTGDVATTGAGGTITIGANDTGTITTGAELTTSGETIRIARAVTLTDNVTISTGGAAAGNIDFDDAATVNDDAAGGANEWNLTLTAGTGDVTFGDAAGGGVGQIGGTQPIADLQVNGTGVTFFSNTAAVAASSVDINAAGTAQINGSITTTGAVTIDSNGGTTLTDTGDVATTGAGGTITIGANDTGTITTGAELTTSGETIRIARAVTLTDNVTISTGGAAAGNIDFDDAATVNDERRAGRTSGT